MRDHEASFRKAGVRLAAVGLGDRSYARAFRGETGIRFPLLIDEHREAYRAAGLRRGSILHLFYRANAVARTRARESGGRQHRLGKNPFQLGGTFVFGPGNKDLFVHVSRTLSDYVDPAALKLETFRSRTDQSPA